MKTILAALVVVGIVLGAASAASALPCKSGINNSCEIKQKPTKLEQAWIDFLNA